MNSSLTPEQRSEVVLTNISSADCGVVAAQAVTRLNRAETEKLVTEYGDYKHGIGISRGAMVRALKHAGYKLTHVPQDHGETAAVFACRCEYGMYIVFTSNHVMALVEGDLHNSRGDWHAPVELAYKVERAAA